MDAAVARRRGHRRRRSWSTGNRWRKDSPVRKTAQRRSQGGCWPNMQARLYRIRAASRRPADRNERPRPEGSPPWLRSYSPPSKYRKLARRFGARTSPSSNQYAYRRVLLRGRAKLVPKGRPPCPGSIKRPGSSPWRRFSVCSFRIRETNRPLYRRRPGVPPRRPARLSHWTHGIGTAVCDRDRIIATAGIPKKDLLDKPVSKQLDELMRRKKAFISSGEDTVLAAEGGLRTANAAFPISCAGDLCGMFLLIKDEDAKPGETQEHLRLGKLASDFLSRETVE